MLNPRMVLLETLIFRPDTQPGWRTLPPLGEPLSRSQGEDEQEGISQGRFLERSRESCVLVLLQELLRQLQWRVSDWNVLTALGERTLKVVLPVGPRSRAAPKWNFFHFPPPLKNGIFPPKNWNFCPQNLEFFPWKFEFFILKIDLFFP